MTYTLFLPLWIFMQVLTPTMQGVAGIGECCHADVIGANTFYNWSPDTYLDCDAEFIPMVRDANQAQQLAGSAVVPFDNILLGFNEPDKCPDQACLTPEEALPIEWWRLTTYSDVPNVSPAPSHENISWLPTFRNLYIDKYGEPPDWDYLAVHCYFWDAYSLSTCKAVVKQYEIWAEQWGIEGGVLVTEFASFAFKYHPDHDFDYVGAVGRGRNFIQWMDSRENVAGYFWFSAYDWGVWGWNATTALFYDDNTLTPLGNMLKEEYALELPIY